MFFMSFLYSEYPLDVLVTPSSGLFINTMYSTSIGSEQTVPNSYFLHPNLLYGMTLIYSIGSDVCP